MAYASSKAKSPGYSQPIDTTPHIIDADGKNNPVPQIHGFDVTTRSGRNLHISNFQGQADRSLHLYEPDKKNLLMFKV
jgi:hypothetical protein